MAASAGSQHRCVFVGNIPYDATEEQLIQICEEVGPVVSFRLVLDRETGKPKGYGFCEYQDEETALSARRNLQGYEINGRQLRVDFAENDKGADRSREQGRGGPGFTSTNDAHKPLSGPPILGDSSLHQPIGHPLAASAASTMARAFGGSQINKLSLMPNGLQNFSALGNDPLTQYLAKMSRQQLNEIMFELKTLATQNKVLAQQLLQGCPQLPKALFQAQIMLGMVTPQMMQMANTWQPSSSVPQSALQNNIPNQNPLLVGPLTRPPESQVPSSTLQNPVILQQSTSIPVQQLPVQPPFQHPLAPQPQTQLPGTVPGKSGITTPPQTFGGLSNQPQVPPLPTSKTLISQVQPPILQHSRTLGGTNAGQHPQSLLQGGLQQSYLLPLISQSGASNYPVLPNGLNSLPKEAETYATGSIDLTLLPRGSMHATPGVALTPQTGTRGEIPEVMNHRAKRPKMEDGGGAHLAVADTYSTISSVPAQPVVPGSVPGSQMANADGLQHTEKQIPLLPPEVEPAVLQQVMNLTPEQLSSLPLEQRQQVLQLQQMLARQNL